MKISSKEIWFVTGSQHLYGPETLQQVASNSKSIVDGLNDLGKLPITLIHKPIVTTSEEIVAVCQQANNDSDCIGIVTWMHTFSPAKMWIAGLNSLSKPLCHLHTQFNAEIPWSTIDMDFMNLNQSAHGDREFGFMMSRMRKNRKVIVGHWKSGHVQEKLSIWSRVALGCDELRNMKVARFGDNMREVAVTDGDKVAAQMRFGVAVNGYDSSDITNAMKEIDQKAIDQLVEEYEATYSLTTSLQKNGSQRSSLTEAAKIELGMRSFLEQGNFKAFTDTFENLGALKQLPGIPVQRLMADGYGFGGEGDWKTAAMVRAMKVMAEGLEGGTSFMEDYTYHFTPEKGYVLGSHMLEICPSIAAGKPSCEVHPLGIGGKEDPVRLVFNAPAGNALNASMVDMGNRFRLIVNEVEAVNPMADLPKLPVARVLWEPKPNLDVAATAWILAGGAHHTVYTQALSTEYMEDFADIFGIEILVIDSDTRIRNFKDQLHANEAYYHLFQHHMM
ncbi:MULTISPECIES: L-arabinose isomerase [Flavobacteriaceae]|uniref:L-arabinose isomerase n=1 Tax=Flavobacteriaceae TaxID=49546 RepID=UPI001491845A|nr:MULTISPECIES: L-arabinose isomerase [Allomuricauda]MDC6365887.1 L-arabinose isomerase [Muricauda sp. AC10]